MNNPTLENPTHDPRHVQKTTALSIRSRLSIGFSIVTLIFILAASVTLSVLYNTKQIINNVLTVDLQRADKLRDFGTALYQVQILTQNWLITRDKSFKNMLDVQWKYLYQTESDVDGYINSADKLTIDKWNNIKILTNNLKEIDIGLNTDTLTANSISSNQLTAIKINTIVDQILSVLDGPVDQVGNRAGGIYDTENNKLNHEITNIISDMSNIQLTEYLVTFVGMIAAIVISLLTARSILRHINIFREYSNKIASRDLRQLLTVESNDEIGQLGNDLNIMTDSLANITKQITAACQNMVTTLEEVKQAVNVQSSGATEQASSINEITASLEEIEKSSTQTLDKAKMLGEAAERTRENGQLGLEAVEQSIIGMKSVREKVQMIAQTILDLSNKTQQVGEITTVVNSLAQQSKMLALNASIEAAKAGEAGKGFAVVASEVKNLAEQSEQSTSQVQKILEDIRQAAEKAVMVTEEGTKGVDHGTSLVEQTGEVVKNLSDVIHETTVASQQIEAAVRQEGVGIEQIAAGMNEINQVTASFVASAKQTTDAINNLSVIAKQLKEHVDTYKV